jgi:hypothetical protein
VPELWTLGNDMKPDKIISEARARIIWGESSSSVFDFLTSNGIPAVEAEAKIKEFNLERSREIRKIGLRNILIGAVITGISIIPICIAAYPMDYGSTVFKRSLVLQMIVAMYGFWKLLIGMIYLVRPQFVRKSIPDIGENDVLQ